MTNLNRRAMMGAAGGAVLAPAAVSLAAGLPDHPAEPIVGLVAAWRRARQRHEAATRRADGEAAEGIAWAEMQRLEGLIKAAPLHGRAGLAALMQFLWIDNEIDRAAGPPSGYDPAISLWALQKIRAFALAGGAA